jgi:hypothetical protein
MMDPVTRRSETTEEVVRFLKDRRRECGHDVTPASFPDEVCRIYARHGCPAPKQGETVADYLAAKGGDA